MPSTFGSNTSILLREDSPVLISTGNGPCRRFEYDNTQGWIHGFTPDWRITLLAAAAMRRVFKLILLSNEAQWSMGEVMHFLRRYDGEELSWNRILCLRRGIF